MSKPNVDFTVKQMKDYIRGKKLNHPAIKLSMRRAELIEGLKKAGHWNSSKDTSPKKKPTKPTKADLSIYFLNNDTSDAIKVKDPEDPSRKMWLEHYLHHYGDYPKIENVTIREREWRGLTLHHNDKKKYVNQSVLVNLLTSKEASDLQKKYKLPSDKTKPYGIYKPEGKDLKKFDTSFYYGWLGKGTENLSEKQRYMRKVKYVRKYNQFGDKIAFIEVNGKKYDWDGLNVRDGFGRKVGELRDSSLLNKWLDGKIHKYNMPEVGKNSGLKMKKS